jgi:peroxiredoxin
MRVAKTILRLMVMSCALLSCFAFGSLGCVLGDEPAKAPVVPQTLLKLIHAQQVQQELGFQVDDAALLAALREVDGAWWRSRNLPEEKQQAVVVGLEKQLLTRLEGVLGKDKNKRLREIEAQAQGYRSLLRPGIAKAVGLSEAQNRDVREICFETDRLASSFAVSKRVDAEAQQELLAAREGEEKKLRELLTSGQQVALAKLVGEPFDTQGLQRILPLAPELIDSGEWAGGEPTTLAGQKGKVVLVHFYAFQCHNCVANFDHYNRWHETLASRGVSVIGIQTPETAAERDIALVRKAAKEKGFGFPVLIDTENKNWDAWGNTMWPTVYVVDRSGYIRTWWQGELNWQGATGDKSIEELVDQLLEETP